MKVENKQKILNNSVEICIETFGLNTNPCVLMIMGATASMLWWDEVLCQQIADKGYFVVRYDHRDTGESTCCPPGEPQYNMTDLTDDAIAILDALNASKAHLVGMSLGGMIAQIAALKYPSRVCSLTLISTSAWDDLPELQHIDKKVMDYHANATNIDWSDTQSLEAYLSGGWKVLNGSKRPFDEQRCRELVRQDINRSKSLLSMFNHNMLTGEEELYGRQTEITHPTIIIHGTEDPVLSFANAKYLHKTIENSELITLDGAGHEISPLDWDIIIKAIER